VISLVLSLVLSGPLLGLDLTQLGPVDLPADDVALYESTETDD
jgi:hypothetical protein